MKADRWAELRGALAGPYTRLPWWHDRRNWRGEEDTYGNYYVHGDRREGDEDDPGDSCVGVAVVTGNPTAGDIPRATADLITAACNSLPALLAERDELLAAVRTFHGLISRVGPKGAGRWRTVMFCDEDLAILERAIREAGVDG